MNSGVLSSFDYLRALAASTVNAAAELPRQDEGLQEWRGLGFQVGGARFVAPLGEAVEVQTMPKVTALPGVANWVLGVANVRGRLLPIIDLHGYLGLTPSTPRMQWRVMIVEIDDFFCGLLVEHSFGIQHFAADSFTDDAPREMDVVVPYVDGSYRQSGRVWYVMSLSRLVGDPKFNDVAEK